MLRKGKIFGLPTLYPLYLLMTFKDLANELMHQGYRCYKIEDIGKFTRGNTLQALAIRSLIEVQVYDSKSLVFVKTIFPKDKK